MMGERLIDVLSRHELLSNQKDPKVLAGSPKPFLEESSMLDLQIFIPDHDIHPKLNR